MAEGNFQQDAVESRAQHWYPLAVAEFKEQYPQTEISIKTGRPYEIEQWILSNDVDFGVTDGDSASALILKEPWYKDELVLVLSRRSHLLKKHQLTLKEVVEEPFLLQAPWGRPTFIERVFAQNGITIKKPVTLGSREAVKAGIAAGYGISLLPRTVIDVELKAKTLKTKKLQNGRIEIGGELPVNTHGGLLSQAHIEGMLHITEAVKQLRGDRVEIERQVKDAKLGIVSGHGANLGAHATLILGRQSS